MSLSWAREVVKRQTANVKGLANFEINIRRRASQTYS
jgi:hypothetical protein